MLKFTETAIQKFIAYTGGSWQFALFAAALLYLLFCREEKRTRPLLAGYSLAFLFVYFCPLTAKIIMTYCTGSDVYWRMLWLLPIPLVIAYVGTRLVMRFSGRISRLLAGSLLAACIVFSGTCVYSPGVTPYVKAQNINKIPVEAVDVCNQINAFRQGRYACITVSYDLVSYIRQYDANLYLTYGRKGRGRFWGALFEELNSPAPNFRRITRITRRMKGNYLVYPATDEQHAEILSLGYEQIGNHEQYRIYYDREQGPSIETQAEIDAGIF